MKEVIGGSGGWSVIGSFTTNPAHELNLYKITLFGKDKISINVLFTISFSLCLSCIHKDNYIKLFGIVSVLYLVEVLVCFYAIHHMFFLFFITISYKESGAQFSILVFVSIYSQPEIFLFFCF